MFATVLLGKITFPDTENILNLLQTMAMIFTKTLASDHILPHHPLISRLLQRNGHHHICLGLSQYQARDLKVQLTISTI